MFARLLVAYVILAASHVRADPSSGTVTPIRVALQCELAGRTKTCPAFLSGLVDEHAVLLASPRAGADVVIYATATAVGQNDRVHLRFVGHMAGSPAPVELEVDLDTRSGDDDQRALLAPVFRRGIALFVAARYPSAIDVVVGVPKGFARAAAEGSPWGIEVGLSANGSYTAQYQSAGAHLHVIARYVTRTFRVFALQMAEGAAKRQPPLVLDDGTRVDLDSKEWRQRGGAEAIYSLSEAWSAGFGSYTFFEDPKAQYKYNSRNRVALEWDRFAADDPRGNRLGVFYHVGWIAERYNIRNVLGERFAQYPSHGIDAIGSVRHDRISFGLNLASDVQLNHPRRRFLLTASPFVKVQLGNHVDLDLSFSITQRTFPVPDPNAIDPSDYQQLSRLAYAEPLSLTGSLGLTFHWDPTNGARNDRIGSI